MDETLYTLKVFWEHKKLGVNLAEIKLRVGVIDTRSDLGSL